VSWKSPWIRVPLWIVVIYAGVCLLVYLVQRRLMYFPDPEPVEPWPGMENVALETEDGVTVMATWWPGNRPVSIILFHGNAGHRGHRFAWMRPLHDLGWSVLLLDYRGYGGSEGSPSQRGLGYDADAAAKWLKEKRPGDDVVYFGESIGASVAVDLATRHEPDGFILQSAGYDFREVGKEHYPWLPLGWMLKDDWSASGKIERLDVPLLMIHGKRDRIIPRRHGRRMFEASPSEKKEWWEIEHAGHNDVPHVADEYYARLHRWLSEAAN